MKNSFLRPSRSVSQPKNSAPSDGAGQVGAGGESDVRIAELQRRALLQRARERARERHLEPVENPGDPERDDDQRVEAPPRQAVEPRRSVGFDDVGGRRGLCMGKSRSMAEGYVDPAMTPSPAERLLRRPVRPGMISAMTPGIDGMARATGRPCLP